MASREAWKYAVCFFALHKAVVWGGSLWFSRSQAPQGSLWRVVKYALVDHLSRWDAGWYIGIADRGYDPRSAAFFPFLPYGMRWIHEWTGLSYPAAGFLIANASFLLALYVMARLLLLDESPGTVRRTLGLMVLFPTSFFFAAPYTEAPFLLWTAASLYFARIGRFWPAGLFGGLAALTRNTGVVLLLPFLYEYFSGGGRRRRRAGPDLAAAALIPAGLAAFMALLQQKIGDPLGFVHAQQVWKRSFHWPWITVWRGTADLWAVPKRGWTLFIHSFTAAVVYLEGILLALPAFWQRLRIRGSYYLYALVSVLVPLLSPSTDWYFLSISRFVLVLFPLFLIAARILENRVIYLAVAAASAVGQLFFLANFSEGNFVA